VSGRDVTLSWLDNSNKELGYRIERATKLDVHDGFTQIPPAPATLAANAVTVVPRTPCNTWTRT